MTPARREKPESHPDDPWRLTDFELPATPYVDDDQIAGISYDEIEPMDPAED